MTRFERDLQEALNGNEIAVLAKRKKELESLRRELLASKNNWRAQCLTQDLRRLQAEYDLISANF